MPWGKVSILGLYRTYAPREHHTHSVLAVTVVNNFALCHSVDTVSYSDNAVSQFCFGGTTLSLHVV